MAVSSRLIFIHRETALQTPISIQYAVSGSVYLYALCKNVLLQARQLYIHIVFVTVCSYSYIFCAVGTSRQTPALLVRVLTILEEIKETQRIQASMLQAVLRRLSTQQDGPTLPDGSDLPLVSLSAFDDFESKAKEPTFQNALVCF